MKKITLTIYILFCVKILFAQTWIIKQGTWLAPNSDTKNFGVKKSFQIGDGVGSDTLIADITIGQIMYDIFLFSGNPGASTGISSDTLSIATVNTTINASNNFIISSTNTTISSGANTNISSINLDVSSTTMDFLASNIQIDADTIGVITGIGSVDYTGSMSITGGDVTYLFTPISAVATYEYATGSNSITLDSNNAEVGVQLGRYKYIAGGYNFNVGSAELSINDTLTGLDRSSLSSQLIDGLKYRFKDTTFFQIDTLGAVKVTGTSAHAGRLRLGETTGNGGNYFGINAASALAANINVTMPSANGTNGQVLTTNGAAGVLSWTTVGGGTGFVIIDSSNNMYAGTDALSSLTTGEFNFAAGIYSLQTNTDGNLNTAVGWNTLNTNVTGSNNTAIGFNAGVNSTGSYNTFLGENTDGGSGDGNCAIGTGAIVGNFSNSIVFNTTATASNQFLVGNCTAWLPYDDLTTTLGDDTTRFSNMYSGTYTPTLVNVTNIAASTAYVTGYYRTGSMVTVFGKVDIDATLSASTATELGIPLPIASNLANEEDLGGTAVGDAIASLTARVRGDATNNRAAVVFKSLSLNNDSYSFEFSYQVK